MAKLS